MPMWQCSSEFPIIIITWRAQAPPCWATRTEHGGVFTGNHPLPIQLYQMETIIACKNNSYKCSIKESAKDNSFFCWQISSPLHIFIKVHLSAISLPRKQLSIENSACFLFCFFVSGLVFCAPVTVCRLTSLSCWRGMGRWPRGAG